MQKKRIIALIIVIGLTGCVEVPLLNLGNESRIKVREEVKTYDIEELQSMKYKQLTPIEGIACSPYISVSSDVKKEDALDELRYRSKSLGGNGIVNVMCGEPVECLECSNCGFKLQCNAVAIQVEPIRHAPNITSAQELKPAQSIEESKKEVLRTIEPVGSQNVEQFKSGVVRITAKPTQGSPKAGTGFIVRLDKDAAYIVTAAHVVAGDSQPKVEFFSKRNVPVPAEMLGLEGDDEVRGLALLVVRGQGKLPNGLTALPLAATVRLSGGEDIIVIGFPRNAGAWAVIKGNISSRQGRDLYFSPTVDSGHSGGPMIQSGKVVGLVAVAGQSSGRGVIARSVHDYVEGFGITVEDHVAPASLESSDNVLVFLKVQELDETLRREFTIPVYTTGVVINYIVPGSPAAAAGLERGDVIVEINHIGVKHLSQYHSVASNITQREMVMLLLNRRGNELFIAVQP